MKLVKILLCACLLVSFLSASPAPARADAAPPGNPPGGSVGVGGITQVEMKAEKVVIDFRISNEKGVKVTADFVFRNTGQADEHLQVRFPLNGESQHVRQTADGQYEVYYPLIEDFRVWADKVRLKTDRVVDKGSIESDFFLGGPGELYWATFPVDFPVDRDVNLRVEYFQQPTRMDYSPVDEVSYILSTGAGWKGAIGDAEIILRFPYSIDLSHLEYVSCPFCPSWQSTIIENELHFRWENFEPGRGHILGVRYLRVSLWQNVLAARSKVIREPENAQAWEELGWAYYQATLIKLYYSWDYELGEQSIHAYQQALALNPNNASLHAKLALALSASGGILREEITRREQALQEISQALAIDPNNSLALEAFATFQKGYPDIVLPTPGASPTPLPPTATVTSTLPPTRTPRPGRPFTHTPTITVTPTTTPLPSLTPPVPTPTATPAPASGLVVAVPWLIGLVVVAASFGAGFGLGRRKPNGSSYA